MIANNKGADQTALIRLRKRPVPLLFFEISRIEAHVILKARYPCFCLAARLYLEINTGLPGVWGVGEKGYIFSRTWAFRDLRSKLKVLRGSPHTPPPSPGKSKLIYFRALTCYSALVLVKGMANNFYYC